jgi:hypothetical protein
MRYNEKIQLKLYEYNGTQFVLQAIVDDYQEVSFEHNLYEAGTFTITINYNIPNATKFRKGLFIQFGDSPYDFGEIQRVQDSLGGNGKGSQTRTITGYDSRYILKRRVIKNLNDGDGWAMTSKGEICMRSLIADQCGVNAETKRQLPIANTIPAYADAIGKEYSVKEQGSNLYEVCKTIATQSEIGWRLNFNGQNLTLECYEGEDRSQLVQFSPTFDSLANGEFIDTNESFSNAVYISGKGQNSEKDLYEGEDGTPNGLDRFESWADESQMTNDSEYEAKALSMLTQYGQTLQMSGNGLAKCPHIYKEQYEVGDWITVGFNDKKVVVQILSVTERWAWNKYDINFSFGKPKNNLADQLQLILRKIQLASNKGSVIDSVRWYTIPTDTAMGQEDLTFNTLGFTGNIGNSDRTFTLYFNNDSKAGSKSYSVYTKNLSGSGKLILSTGVSGASNLVLPAGNNVASMYVDENGNIISSEFKTISNVNAINGKIPSNASSSNQLATQSDVNSAINSYSSVIGQEFDISPSAFTLSGSEQAVNCGALNKGKYIIVVSLLNHISYGYCRFYTVGGSVTIVNMGRCETTGNAGQLQQTGIGFANITTDNTPTVLVFGGNLTGQTNGDKNFWYVKAYRIG